MGYKLLGFIVWRFLTGYVRWRLRALGTGRRLVIAGGALAVLAALAGATRRPTSGQLTP